MGAPATTASPMATVRLGPAGTVSVTAPAAPVISTTVLPSSAVVMALTALMV